MNDNIIKSRSASFRSAFTSHTYNSLCQVTAEITHPTPSLLSLHCILRWNLLINSKTRRLLTSYYQKRLAAAAAANAMQLTAICKSQNWSGGRVPVLTIIIIINSE